ncbi:hypothetical protein D3C80_1788840 [compost metagenome]
MHVVARASAIILLAIARGNAAAENDTRVKGEIVECGFQNGPTDIVEHDVDTFWGKRPQAFSNVLMVIVDGCFEARIFHSPAAFFSLPAEPITRAPKFRAIWPAIEPTLPAAVETKTVLPGLGAPAAVMPK